MNELILPAAAKINLYLDITSKRSDGYHGIASIMQSVSLCDEITVSIGGGHGIGLFCDNPSLPLGKDNIAYRAAEAFLANVATDCGVTIGIKKNIPVAAGLAGGSTDAAAVLRGLNRLLGHPFSTDGLCRIAGKLGADVPFCVVGGCARCEGVGEMMTPISGMPDVSILIACPTERVSTPEAYRRLDVIYNDFSGYKPELDGYYAEEAGLGRGDISGICSGLYNVFEKVQEDRQDISDIKRIMTASGALGCLMSGSGPSVFGIFESDAGAVAAESALQKSGIEAHICRPTGKNRI